jgi:hypothetical protein
MTQERTPEREQSLVGEKFGTTSWEVARNRLANPEEQRTSWLATTRPGGRPHGFILPSRMSAGPPTRLSQSDDIPHRLPTSRVDADRPSGSGSPHATHSRNSSVVVIDCGRSRDACGAAGGRAAVAGGVGGVGRRLGDGGGAPVRCVAAECAPLVATLCRGRAGRFG